MHADAKVKSPSLVSPVGCCFAMAVLLLPLSVMAQLNERPGNSLDDPIDSPHDLSGLSIKTPRVRIVHTTDPTKAGGSMYLQQADPWLGFQWGRNLTQREFRERDGVYGDAGKLDGPLLPDGTSHLQSRSHVNSCAVCHNTPYRDGGGGAVIPKNGGEGRRTPHMFGAGLVEMLGQQIRLQALDIADVNRDGWISLEEAKGKRCVIYPLGHPSDPNSEASAFNTPIDYGSFEDLDDSGKPSLNPVFNPIYVDKEGRRIPFAHSLKFPGVAGYTVEVQCFGFGHLYMPFRPPVSTTLRSFIATPFDIHMGLQAFDPTTLTETTPQGLSQFSNPGCQQCLTAAGKDRGAVRGPTGISLDDPDRDGYCEEISEGDLDMAEWYLMNHPSPGRGKMTAEVKVGEQLFARMGCAACHVPDWHLYAANPRAAHYTRQYAGDRRFFDLQVEWNETNDRLEGKLVSLADHRGPLTIPRRAGYTMRGFYSDLKYHDVGEAFYQMQYDGTLVKKFRTTPLWGVATSAVHGHDGASLTLHDAIRRHGGEALESRKAYSAATESDRRAVISFLESLVLYQTDQLPCDINGDGKIAPHYIVAGMDTGEERFNPEWLFRVPGKIEGPVTNLKGDRIKSFALTNVFEAYGLGLEYLKDSDHDGFPDVIDPEPFKTGYKDGVH